MYASFPLLSRNLLSPRGAKTYFYYPISPLSQPAGPKKDIAVTVASAIRTPNFSSFMACVNRGLRREWPQSFPWSLHPGLKLLEMRSRNSTGAEGITNTAILEI